jgi:hypothetical protein
MTSTKCTGGKAPRVLSAGADDAGAVADDVTGQHRHLAGVRTAASLHSALRRAYANIILHTAAAGFAAGGR